MDNTTRQLLHASLIFLSAHFITLIPDSALSIPCKTNYAIKIISFTFATCEILNCDSERISQPLSLKDSHGLKNLTSAIHKQRKTPPYLDGAGPFKGHLYRYI